MADPRHGKKRVLIIDPSADNRQVLATALDRQGLEVLEAPGWRTARNVLAASHPQVVVIDEESVEIADLSGDPADQTPTWIVLGTYRAHLPNEPVHVVPKPYHYAPLIRRILALLEGNRP